MVRLPFANVINHKHTPFIPPAQHDFLVLLLEHSTLWRDYGLIFHNRRQHSGHVRTSCLLLISCLDYPGDHNFNRGFLLKITIKGLSSDCNKCCAVCHANLIFLHFIFSTDHGITVFILNFLVNRISLRIC